MPDATGNLADLINNLFGVNSKGINVISSGLGTLADFSGAGETGEALVILVAALGLFTFGSNSKPDPLQPILDALANDFADLHHTLEDRWQEEDARHLADEVRDAEAIFQTLDGLVSGQPPITEVERLDHIATCLAPLNPLSDSSIQFPSPFFLTLYSEQVIGEMLTTGNKHLTSLLTIRSSPICMYCHIT
jgi:hypothetical protein